MDVFIGCDLIRIERLRKITENKKHLQKIFHEKEIEECLAKHHPLPSFAARFAAKEAFFKALGTGFNQDRISLSDVWIEKEEKGRPYLCFSPELKERFSIKSAQVSLSHDGEYAMATVSLTKT